MESPYISNLKWNASVFHLIQVRRHLIGYMDASALPNPWKWEFPPPPPKIWEYIKIPPLNSYGKLQKWGELVTATPYYIYATEKFRWSQLIKSTNWVRERSTKHPRVTLEHRALTPPSPDLHRPPVSPATPSRANSSLAGHAGSLTSVRVWSRLFIS